MDPLATVFDGLEHLPLAPASLDLATSALALQGVNDLPGALVQIRAALKPDGLFVGSLVGGRTLHELRAVLTEAEAGVSGGSSPRVAPFADVRDMGGLLQRAGFALPVADSEIVTVRYPDLFAPDGRSPRDGRHQRTRRTIAPADAASSVPGGGPSLRRASCRPGRPDPRHVRHRVPVGLGAASLAGQAGPARFGQRELGGGAGRDARSDARRLNREGDGVLADPAVSFAPHSPGKTTRSRRADEGFRGSWSVVFRARRLLLPCADA